MRKLISRLLLRFYQQERKVVNWILLRCYKSNEFEVHLKGGFIRFEIWGPFSMIACYDDTRDNVEFNSELERIAELVGNDLRRRESLEHKLKEALENEDYQETARIRDKMKER